MAWALVGSLIYLLAYGYYTIAGVFPLPGSEAIGFLIEFGTVMGSLGLFAVVLGIRLVPAAEESLVKGDRPTGPGNETIRKPAPRGLTTIRRATSDHRVS